MDEDAPFHVERLDGFPPVIKMVGEMDMDYADWLRSGIVDLVGEGEAIAIDLKDVTFVDSSGLGALLMLRDRVGKDQDVEIRNAPSNVRCLLENTGVAQLFRLT